MRTHQARQDGALPAAAALGSLLEVLCGRGYGALAVDVLHAMADAAMPLSSRLCCLVMLALLRGGKLLAAYEVFARFLEPAGGADAEVASLRTEGYNVEHPLALLCKAGAKQCRGLKAYAVYDAARRAGLVANFGSFGLPALTLACVSDGLLAEACNHTYT